VITLKYKDEEDRAYGLSGMAVSMYLLDHEKYIDELSLDAEADKGLRFTADFFHLASPSLSAKAVWADNLSRFNLLNGLIISNLLSRAKVRSDERVNSQLYRVLGHMLAEEGKEMCSLDEDEASALYNKNFSYFEDVFDNTAVVATVRDMASQLMQRRTLNADEVYVCMRPLRRW
jgi:hypothetical protein